MTDRKGIDMSIISPETTILTAEDKRNHRRKTAEIVAYASEYTRNYKMLKKQQDELRIQELKKIAEAYKERQKQRRILAKQKRQNNSYMELKLKAAIGCHKKIYISEMPLELFWRKNYRITADIKGTVNSTKFIVEYDGSYWHNSKIRIQGDIDKTKILLDNGYTVIRIREAPLSYLDINHPKLTQIIYTGSKDHKVCNFKELALQVYFILGLKK